MYENVFHRTNDLTRKLEKVGPFECDELEKHFELICKQKNVHRQTVLLETHLFACVDVACLDLA